jgi:hypothetical protein
MKKKKKKVLQLEINVVQVVKDRASTYAATNKN